MKRSDIIKQKAISLGFSGCGISRSEKLQEEVDHLREYIERGLHGNLEYMARNFEKRLDTSLLVEGSKSVITVLLNYYPEFKQKGKDVPLISKYAYGKDYHLVIKDKLFELLDFINKEISPVKGRAFVGSAPVLEKERAVKAGLGWIGKNGLLLNKELGSFFFIGELIIDLELEYDEPFRGEYCGSCTKCIDSCPTKAFVKPFVLNVGKCISYLTIEVDDELPEEFREEIGVRVYGCDTCQDVCPWNQRINFHNVEEFKIIDEILRPDTESFKEISEDDFNRIFADSAISRSGYKRFKRNVHFAFPE